MDKKTLQNTILEKAYQPGKWLEVMKDYFGVRKLHQKPQPVSLPSNVIAHSAVELGGFYTVDERVVGIYEVELTNKALIDRNRVGLRNLFKSIIRYDLDAALIVYIQGNKWRFSYVSEIRTAEGKKETEPKRYTYLFGEGESCRTAAERFDKLRGKPIYLNDLFEAFSVERLNKEFFKIYKVFYEKFWKYLAADKQYNKLLSDKRFKDNEAKREKPIRDFAKRLLGRIVFLQFLQKKGWMGVSANNKEWEGGNPKFLQTLFANSNNKQSFHSKELRTLFFETLNEKRKNHLAPDLLGKDIKIPYLNGGLFDKDISFENDIDFPEDYFAKLLDFFEHYNFTIDENDPYDREVGIDPEMLGHIFENLLEENREKGAFYTPKEIVRYMCQESLIEYLHTQLPDYDKTDIELLVRNNQVSEVFAQYQVANKINDKLKVVKICDPAIGSGAFPMGLLKEIFECRRLLYGYLKTNDNFDPAQIKKEIIQQNIYGVDLENGAVEIARLRFWLALVVDETEPHPLPNLDYKIMQGNSLLERFANVDLQNLLNNEDEVIVSEVRQLTLGEEFESPATQLTIFIKANKEELFTLIKKYFDPDEWEKQTGEIINKAAVKRQINDFVEGKIHAFILKCQRDIDKDINAVEKKWKDAGATDHSKLNQKSKEYKQYLNWKKQLEELDAVERKLIELQKADDRPFFLWHLWFKDVFDKGGFDVMIGNPPYIQLQSMGVETDILENANFKTFSRRGDIYCLFYEKGFELLKKNGILIYITSNKWMRGGYGKNLRKFFSEVNTKKIINLGPRIFHSATVDTNIYIGQNAKFENIVKGITIDNRDLLASLENDNLIPMSDVNSDAWVVLDNKDILINKFFENRGRALRDWNIKINFGIKTGFNEAYIIDEDKKDNLVNSDSSSLDLIKKLARGRNIERFSIEESKLWIIITKYGSSEYLKEMYPAIYDHLSAYKLQLSKRGQCTNKGGLGQHHWLELDNNPSDNYLNQFKGEKVVWKRVGSIMRFAYSDEEIYCLDSTCIATGEKIKYLTSVLNSKAGLYQLFRTSPQTGTGDQIISVQALEPLLVHYPSDEVEAKFNLIVDYILFIKKTKEPLFQYITNDHISGFFEELVDMMVYELYFEEEMKAKEIDVLKFVTEKTFPDITKVDDQKAVIHKVYDELQQKDNPIRNRILVASSRSETIARINAATS